MRTLLLALLLLPTLAVAGEWTERSVAGLTAEASRHDLASVQHQQSFVQKEKDGTDLRVGLVVIDLGGSTDVSPKAQAYLTMFNEAEMKNATSLHLLTHLNELVSAKRTEAGIYEVVVKRYDVEGAWGGGEITTKLVVDARLASVDVRKMKGVEEFDTGTILTPIKITESLIQAGG